MESITLWKLGLRFLEVDTNFIKYQRVDPAGVKAPTTKVVNTTYICTGT